MPFYEYQCAKCTHEFEAMQKITSAPLRKCPSCGKQSIKRLISAPVFRLKGSGWYETDFKGDKDKKRNLAGETPADKSDDNKADSGAAKSDEKSGDKEGVASSDKPAEQLSEKKVDKPAEKSADKPVQKPAPELAKKSASKIKPPIKGAAKITKKK